MVDLTFKVPSHHFSPWQMRQDTKGMSWINYSNFYSLLRFPRTHLQCQQSNEPLSSNEGYRLPFNIGEELLVGAGGYGNARGDPCCGRPWGTSCLHFLSPLWLTPFPSPRLGQSPTTTSKPNVDADIPRMKWQAQWQHGERNVDVDDMASPTTTRRAQHWRGWRGKSNDNMVSTTLAWMTCANRPGSRRQAPPNKGSSVVLHTQPPNDASSPVSQTTTQTASVRMTKPPDDANTPGSCNWFSKWRQWPQVLVTQPPNDTNGWHLHEGFVWMVHGCRIDTW